MTVLPYCCTRWFWGHQCRACPAPRRPERRTQLHYHLHIGLRGVGDTVAVSALVRDLYALDPDIRLSVSGTASEEIFRYDHRVSRKIPPDRVFVGVDYRPVIDRSFSDPSARYMFAGHESFERVTKIRVPRGPAKPDLVLSPAEQVRPEGLPYHLIANGVKSDISAKLWVREYAEEVVREVGGRWLQVGGLFSGRLVHHQVSVPGTENLIGKTSLRQLMRLVAHADAVLCLVSLPMLLASAFGVKCVVPAGGRENPSLFEGLGVDYLETMNQLPCSVRGGCCVCAIQPPHDLELPPGWLCKDPVVSASGEWVGKCMMLITPQEVTARLRSKQLG